MMGRTKMLKEKRRDLEILPSVLLKMVVKARTS